MEIERNQITTICCETDERLWGAYDRSNGGEFHSHFASNLIFPVYSGERNGALRVSEQEARFLFAESICNTPYCYSIETPTKKGYQLTGSKSMSAQTDLTLYDHDRRPILNVEFKAKGKSTSARSLFSIEKDIQKLLREPVAGMWFHILEAVDNSTLPKLFNAFSDSISNTTIKFKNEIEQNQIIFHFCVLKQHFSLHKHIKIDQGDHPAVSLKNKFSFDYRVNRSEVIDMRTTNGWFVHRSEMGTDYH